MKKDVKMMIISEYHPDSVFSTTKTASDAMKGAFEYIKYDKPDLIIVDDPSSNILYPEIFADDCFLYDPVKNFMDKQLDIYQEFVQNLRKSSPTSEIYVTLTDASWYNIRRLTKRMVLREVNSNKKLLDDKEKEISKIDKEIKKLKEKGGDKKELMRLYGKKGGLMRSLNILGGTLTFRMPRQESPEYTKGRKETTKRYIDELSKRSPPRTHVIPELLDVEVGGNSIKYSHNYEKLSQTPKLHGFKHLLDELNKEYIQSYEPTDFVLMSGHHGITINHPFRHDKKDEYSLVASAMVMEDQEMVREVASGKFRGDILQEKYGNLEAVKRFTKAYPSPGVMSVGRIDGCFFVNTYSMDHLARVGTGEIDVEEIEYEYVPFLSDIHLGKGASS
ncbi:MAG: hypothetical protein J7L45_00710 [Candidatus Aenigmarchaeota archaeon]|nr:hypothetical protein [Candidatus Aenigmarchaeota archaeon]